MSPENEKALQSELCRRWPKKFSAEDLSYWCRELAGYRMEDISVALTKYRNTTNFTPKVPAIKELLPGYVAQTADKPKDLPFSEVVRRCSPLLQTASVIEILMRYWRQEWWRYKMDAEARRESAAAMMPMAAARVGITLELYRVSKACADSEGLRDKQYNGELTRCLNGCAASLAAESVPVAHCASYADWIEVGPDQFRTFLDDIRMGQIVDPFA